MCVCVCVCVCVCDVCPLFRPSNKVALWDDLKSLSELQCLAFIKHSYPSPHDDRFCTSCGKCVQQYIIGFFYECATEYTRRLHVSRPAQGTPTHLCVTQPFNIIIQSNVTEDAHKSYLAMVEHLLSEGRPLNCVCVCVFYVVCRCCGFV